MFNCDRLPQVRLIGDRIYRVSKSLSERWHSCPKCGQELDRDYNSPTPLAPLPGGDGGWVGLLSTQGEDITSVKTAVRAFLAEESRALP